MEECNLKYSQARTGSVKQQLHLASGKKKKKESVKGVKVRPNKS